MNVSAILTPTPGCSPWRLRPALAAFRLPSRTVAAQPTCAAQVAAVLYWNNPFGTIRWRRAERHFLSRWLSFGEYAAKFSSREV